MTDTRPKAKRGLGPRKRSLIANIRFQLDQLSASNAHHDFEHICRHFARARISPSLLPATGPVSTGGDGGRDFETFTTFIRGTQERTGVFRGQVESKPLAFACSITSRSKVRAKIRDDVAKICSQGSPHIVYFFSNQSIPVSTRHDLQGECQAQHGCRLEILDGEALAEHFADAELFWIAEEYLHVPSDLFPEPQDRPKSAYTEARDRWFTDGRTPQNFADFVSIKWALREATFNEQLKVDLVRWIRVMEQFIAPSRDGSLVRRAMYEVCVAALRGLHDLRLKTEYIKRYLSEWQQWTSPAELRDTAVLLSYASSAVLLGEFEFDTEELRNCSVEVAQYVEQEIDASDASPNRKADLIYTRSVLANRPFDRSASSTTDPDENLKWWFKLLSLADKAPLFCLEEFVDGLTKLTPFLSEHPDFHRVLRRADEVLEKRTSGFVVAEKCRDRAFELIELGRLLPGISELHRAKVRWFTGDTLRPTLLAMLTLGQAYRALGLVWAAKYYSLGAAFIAHRSDEDDLKPLFVAALQEVAACCHDAGEWVSFAELLPIILVAHYQYQEDPDDWGEHEQLQTTVFHYYIARAIANAVAGQPAVDVLGAPVEKSEALSSIRGELLAPDLDVSNYESLTQEQVRALAVKDLVGIPLCDTGPVRRYRWSALGIQWEVTCDNKRDTLAEVEQLVAILQIALADMAAHDLCLLPTTVLIEAKIGDVSRAKAKEVPGNGATTFSVTLPRESAGLNPPLDDLQMSVCSIALFILTQCSCLSDKDLMRALKNVMDDGLAAKVFIARPYSELFLEFTSPESFDERRSKWLGPSDWGSYVFPAAKELAWPETPGPGYSKEAATEIIGNRYRRGASPISLTIRRLSSSQRFQRWVAEWRSLGKKDWWILLVLLNVVLNYRARLEAGGTDKEALSKYFRENMSGEEAPDALEFPEEELYQESVRYSTEAFIATTTKTWHLQLRSRTPDFKALERLLDVRYGQGGDDVAHEDPFAIGQSANESR